MNDPYDRRAQNRLRAQLEATPSAGSWMPWAGAAVAILLWGGVAVWLIATVGLDNILNQPPTVLAGGFAAVLAPGLALICAGIMAREAARSAQANALVLTSARLLLEPAESARDDIASIAESVARETQAMNRALSEGRQRLDSMKHDIEASVTAALKAAEIVRADSEVLVHKMSAERQGMVQLADSLRVQSEALAKAIPRHAEMMADATRAAQEQVRQADSTLDQRLRDMAETSEHLAQRIAQLDTMSAESRKRAQNLTSVLMRLDEQLVQSTRMVEAATKAGELAAAATKSTAESLRDTVSDAIGSALKATETINTRSAQASEEARQAMALLKEAGLQAEATTRAATHAVRTQADETEKRINQLSDSLFKTATRATSAAEDGLERARARIEKASALLGRMREDTETSSVDDLILEPETPPIPLRPQAAPAAAKPTATSTAKAANGANGVHADSTPAASPRPVEPPRTVEPPRPVELRVVENDELVLDQPVASPRAGSRYDALFGGSDEPITTWRGLLSGINGGAPAPQETASAIIDKLDRAGVRLGVVKASDLRRIATAAYQGERQRRRAIRDTAPGEIQRVSRMLEADRDLETAARSFVAAEEPDALRTLSLADRAREDAAPRLSAYLLLDAALGAQA